MTRKSKSKNFDEHIVCEILSRLPVKSVLRFKCVSKRWCSLIRDPYFVDLHSARSITRPGGTFFISSEQTKDRYITFFGSKDYDGPHFYTMDYVSFISDFPAIRSRKFGPHFFSQDYYDFDTYDKLTYIQILNGLVFMSFKEETIWIINPSTRKMFLLTKANFKEEEIIKNKDVVYVVDHAQQYNWMNTKYYVNPNYGFGFDPVTKKYKVICIYGVEVYYIPPEYYLFDSRLGIEHEFELQYLTSYYRCKVLTVDGDCCWRSIDIPPKPVIGDPVYVNGVLYWKEDPVFWNWDEMPYYDPEFKCDEVIVAFDISTEKFSSIKTLWPVVFLGGKHQQHKHQQYLKQLYEVDGYLAVLDNSNTTGPNTIVIWKLVIPKAADAADAADAATAASCWVKETILTLSFDWSKKGYRFEVIGKNQILLKRFMDYSRLNETTSDLCYYDRDNNDIDHGNKTKKKTSTCDDEKLEFTGKSASFIPSFHTWVMNAAFKYPTFFHSCRESLWPRS